MTNTYQTTVQKNLNGKWKAETMVKNINGYDWEISTYKWDKKGLVCMAQACQKTEFGTTFVIFQDPSIKLYQVQGRGTEKAIKETHEMGLLAFDKLIASGELPHRESSE
ncbi:hypothetical protein ATE84_2930 [Aquimarina sp. MAR_2010_214]|uniref:hypothetical protein n=1 Tax=Aquimarina sp. MAR_2010_214 TaxID=1250026 RepID=UPI000C70CA2D|nr:hypothetical protein [Aquimarina sp. MAR_2010_214]PKV50862.1 hypothetical protein ATE84_2930 [Aquimarina sp. MAR_2010_214]